MPQSGKVEPASLVRLFAERAVGHEQAPPQCERRCCNTFLREFALDEPPPAGAESRTQRRVFRQSKSYCQKLVTQVSGGAFG